MYEVNVRVIEQLISLQKSSLKLYIYYSLGIIGLGLLLLACGLIIFESDSNIGKIISSGGPLVASFSGFSFKEFLGKKENINLFETIKLNIEIFKEDSAKQSQFEITLQNYLFKK